LKEIIIYKNYGRINWQPSDENGIFGEHVHLVTSYDESPRVMIFSTMHSFDSVRVMDAETKRKFLELERQIKELTDERNALVEANFHKMAGLTWEWMRQHQKPDKHIPEPFEHKKIITSLRRGSKVMVDASTDAVRWRMACKVGKLRKKGPKNALVEIEGKHYRVPYYVLLPYNYQQWLREKRKVKESERSVRMSDEVTRVLNKVIA